jgi:hypothetical protein
MIPTELRELANLSPTRPDLPTRRNRYIYVSNTR